MNREITEIITKRILKRTNEFKDFILDILGDNFQFAIAGNALNKQEPNDYDLYAIGKNEFSFIEIKKKLLELEGGVLTETVNALTVKFKNTVLQFCRYKLPTLKELVDTFDFAHIQIGASFTTKVDDNNGYKFLKLEDIYASKNWEKAKMLETTFYTKPKLEGSYPLSSLLRIFKYKERGVFNDKSYIISTLEILNQIVLRGYKDYNDFKDQLAAVDLKLLEQKESDAAWNFYQTCCDKNLVENPSEPRKEDDFFDRD